MRSVNLPCAALAAAAAAAVGKWVTIKLFEYAFLIGLIVGFSKLGISSLTDFLMIEVWTTLWCAVSFVGKHGKIVLVTGLVICLQAGLEGQLQQQGVQQRASSRRREAGARGTLRGSNDPLRATSEQQLLPLPHEEATTSPHAQADQPILRTTAVDAAATAAAAVPISSTQQWEGNSLVGRVLNTAQNSMVQPLAQSGLWHTANMAGDVLYVGQGVQLSRVGGAKLSRKRSAEKDDMQPAPKRWQVDASVDGDAKKRNTLLETANAARDSRGGRSSMEATQIGVLQGGMALHTESALNSAAIGQQYMRMDDWAYV